MGTDIHGIFQRKVGNQWIDVPTEYKFNRHYLLFSVLADVRNGYGFAGVPTYNPVKPIALPRGLPDDFEHTDDEHITIPEYAPEWQVEDGISGHISIWMGDHDYSWLTSAEMLDYEAHDLIKYGVISKEEYLAWDGDSAPDSYRGGISGRLPNGQKIIVINDDPDEFRAHEDYTHVRIAWNVDVASQLKYFFDEIRRLKDLYGEVRFVFGFDS